MPWRRERHFRHLHRQQPACAGTLGLRGVQDQPALRLQRMDAVTLLCCGIVCIMCQI